MGGSPRPFRGAFRLDPRSRAPDEEALGREVDEELAFHLDEAAAELIAAGWEPSEARSEARRRFGDVAGTRAYCVGQQARRAHREERTMRIDELLGDVKYALRQLRKAPAYSATVVATLAVGIAAATVVFSIVNAYFLRPLPYGDAEELVQLGQVEARYGWDGARFSLAMIEDYAGRAASLSEVSAYVYGWRNVTGDEGPERLQGAWLTANTFDVLRADAALGRTFRPEEGTPGGPDVVVLSHGLWNRRYGADPGVLGRVVRLDGTPHTIVGVMPPRFNYPFGGVKLWTPVKTTAAGEGRDRDVYLPVVRLADGWSRPRAREELEAIQGDLAARHPDLDGRYDGISVKPLREALNFSWDVLRSGLGGLMAAVVLVLAISCVNVASLTLARAHRRAREVAVRAAIGAGRGRIARQLLVESLMLALLGGALGTLLAWRAAAAIAPMLPEDLYRVGDVTVDPFVLLFTAAVTLATPVLFGLAPALRATRRDLATTLRTGGRGTGGRTGFRARRALVVAELALAVVLVSGTGLMLRSVLEIQGVDVGFQHERLLTVEVNPPAAGYADAAALQGYFRDAAAALEGVPGVEAVGQVYPLPMNHENIPRRFATPGAAPAGELDWPSALWASVGSGYFDAMGIPVVAGRGFDRSDEAGGAPVVVISRTLAERHLGTGDAVGKTLLLADGQGGTPATVVGVVGNVRQSGYGGEGPDLHLYRPLTQDPRRRRFFVVSAGGEPRALAAPVRRALAAVDGDLPVSVRPMDDIVAENTYQWTVGSLFLGVFGAVAVLLASLGVYGLVSFSVTERRRELGVRMAMGAAAADIRSMVLGDGLRLAAVGGGIGLAAALVLARVAASAFFGVSPSDPVTFAAVAALFGSITLLASLLPARRAVRVDPAEVLRSE